MSFDESLNPTPPNPPSGNFRQRNLITGAMWMVLLNIGLFFLPLLNGFIAGIVGGYKVGSPGRGLMAAVVPSIVAALAVWAIATAVGFPILGATLAPILGLVIALSQVSLFIGAAIGGYLSPRTSHA